MFINKFKVCELTFNANGTVPIGDANDLMTPESMENLFSTLDANLRRNTFVKTEDVTYGIEKSDQDDDSEEVDTFNDGDNAEPDDEYARMAEEAQHEVWQQAMPVAYKGFYVVVHEDEFDKYDALAAAYRPNSRDAIRMNLRKLRDLIMNGKCRRSHPAQCSWKDSTRRPRPFRSFNGQVKRVPKALR